MTDENTQDLPAAFLVWRDKQAKKAAKKAKKRADELAERNALETR